MKRGKLTIICLFAAMQLFGCKILKDEFDQHSPIPIDEKTLNNETNPGYKEQPQAAIDFQNEVINYCLKKAAYYDARSSESQLLVFGTGGAGFLLSAVLAPVMLAMKAATWSVSLVTSAAGGSTGAATAINQSSFSPTVYSLAAAQARNQAKLLTTLPLLATNAGNGVASGAKAAKPASGTIAPTDINNQDLTTVIRQSRQAYVVCQASARETSATPLSPASASAASGASVPAASDVPAPPSITQPQ
ncbi:hypothetical protein [Burkholderia savannae]|uniref:hypothetical protein n=1 Tax=Burkholderia savannae TaxID=1637837 RepID=UPI000A7F2E18|nr:hypothetical protein [Burkholderia savannae]